MAAKRHLVVLMTLGTALCVQAGDFPQILGEPRPAGNQPWASQIREAQQLVNSAPEQARAHYELILAEHPNSDGARQAIQGIADTFVVTRDYAQLTRFLENQMSSTRTPEISRSAREVYTRVASTVDNAHMQAYQRYSQVQREYDDISWFNIFRIFDKFKMRGELKDLKQDLDYITEVKMGFNPANILPADQMAGGGNWGGGKDDGEDPLPLPGGNGNGGIVPPPIGGKGGSGSMDLPDPGDLPEPGSLPDPGSNPGGMPPEFDGVRAEGDTTAGGGPNLDLDPSGNTQPSADPSAAPAEEEGEEEVAASGTAPGGAADDSVAAAVEEKLKAVQLLKGELQQILALVPADRRDQAKEILVGNGGFAVLPALEAAAASETKGSETAATGASGATGSSGTGAAGASGATGAATEETVASTTGASGATGTEESSATASDTADPTASASTTVASGEPAETTGSDSAGESTAASGPATTPAAPDVASLKTEMELAYQQVLASMRQGSSTSLQATQQRYIQAMEKYRAAAAGQPVGETAASRTAGAEGSEDARTAASETANTTPSTQASGTLGSQTLGGTPANGLGGIDPQQLNTGGPVKVNPGVGTGGAPLSDAGIRNIRSGLR